MEARWAAGDIDARRATGGGEASILRTAFELIVYPVWQKKS